MSNLATEQVARLAQLARIDLTDDELTRFAADLSQILDAVASVQQAVAEDTPATSHPVPMTNVFRPDEVRPSLGAEAALAGAPEAEEQRFAVPRILDEE